jgi:hypothetical protein
MTKLLRVSAVYTRTAFDATAAGELEAFARHFPLQAPHWESAINAALLVLPG